MEWIELAPRHKYGLPIATPFLPAAGTIGYSDEAWDWLDYRLLGALITHPVSWHPRSAAAPPRVVTRGTGFIIHTGLPNPGLPAVIRHHQEAWKRLKLPVIVHLIATTPEETARACETLTQVTSVAGVELGLADGTRPAQALAHLAAAQASGLPVIVRVPFRQVDDLAPALARAGADALTLTAPPRGLLPTGRGVHLRGRLFDPALLPLTLQTVAYWASRLEVPILACGGISSLEDAQACLEVGAVAVQGDALLWRDSRWLGGGQPGAPPTAPSAPESQESGVNP